MFQFFRQNNALRKTADMVYKKAVAQARQEVFYRSLSVPDTVEGRFDMIVLHIFLLLHHWKPNYGKDDELGKFVIEAFFSEVEHTLREMGIGDLSIPKRMQKLADAFYGRLYAYTDGLEAQDKPQQLQEALLRNLYAVDNEIAELDTEAPATNHKSTENENLEQHAGLMAHYMRQSLEALSTQDNDDIRKGQFHFPNLEDIFPTK